MTKKQRVLGLTVILAIVLGLILNHISNDVTVAAVGVVGVLVAGVAVNWYINNK